MERLMSGVQCLCGRGRMRTVGGPTITTRMVTCDACGYVASSSIEVMPPDATRRPAGHRHGHIRLHPAAGGVPCRACTTAMLPAWDAPARETSSLYDTVAFNCGCGATTEVARSHVRAVRAMRPSRRTPP